MKVDEFSLALLFCGLPGNRNRPRLRRLVQAGMIGRRNLDIEDCILALLVCMSQRPARETESTAAAMMYAENAEAAGKVELLLRGFHDINSKVYVVSDWHKIDRVHVDLVEPVAREARLICRIPGQVLVEQIGKPGGWWGARPSPPNAAGVLPNAPPDRRRKDRRG